MRKKQRKTFWKPVAAGFGAVYVLTMALAAFLVKEKFVEDYERQFKEAAVSIGREASEKEFAMEGEEWSEEDRKDFYQSLADKIHWTVQGGMINLSVAFYDEEMNMLAKSQEEIGGNTVCLEDAVILKYPSFRLDDYLTWEEKEQLAGYNWKFIQSSESYPIPNPFRFSVQVSPDGQELWGIYVQQITWQEEGDWNGEWYEDPLTKSRCIEESGVMVDYGTGEEISKGKTYYETDSQIVWQWINQEIDDETRKEGKISRTSVTFPYMDSYERWKRWSTSPYLHQYQENGKFLWKSGEEEPSLITASDNIFYRTAYQLQIGLSGEPFSYMEIRMECQPWQDAFAYMRYACGAGLVLTLACIVKITRALKKIYDQQTALEETRRDFTNAIAHELKTPLGIIRNFAENLIEHNMEEKREYYLTQIIGQTEEMNQLVIKMIEVSKLDSEELVLRKEKVFFSELIREQTARFEPVIQEKHIHVSNESNEDFVVDGDKEYLAKAVWNLLANAVDYTVPKGSIWINLQRGQCSIENTGSPMGKEELQHAFELFYTGNKSRSKTDRHIGMGLFLAKKILDLHGLNLTLENTDNGVRAVIR